MRKVTVRTYSLAELSPAARTAAIEAHRHLNVSHGWWSDMHKDFAAQLAEKGLHGTAFFWCLDQRFLFADDLAVADPVLLVRSAWGEELDEHKAAHLVDAIEAGSMELCRRRLSHRVEKNYVAAYTGDQVLDREIVCRIGSLVDGMLAGFLLALRDEHEHLVSDDAVAEALEAGGFEFVELGDDWPAGWG